MAKTNTERRQRVKRSIRGKLSGSAERPRVSVYRSNQYTYAQIIDDVNGHTLAAVSTAEEGIKGTGSGVEQSMAAGQRLAERAREAGIESVVFDRNGYKYHGRVKALADGARTGGLTF